MTIQTYKGYTIETIGISRYIYRPGTFGIASSDAYAQSLVEAKQWINNDSSEIQKKSA